MADTIVVDKKSLQVNKYRPKAPFVAKALENYPIVKDGAPGDTRHIVIDLEGSGIEYVEGQSIGVVPPGTTDDGKPHKLRLYSIASSRNGDDGDRRTVSLSIKRLVYNHPDTGEEVKGVCSNFLCDLNPGDEVMLTGPVGKSFLLPNDLDATIILIATGTGIAPFRAFIRHLLDERNDFKGKIWLFFGVPTSSTILYNEDLDDYATRFPENFKIDYAISREQKTEDGKKMYVQNRMADYTDELWELLKKDNTYTYICGLKGMEDGINAIMSPKAEAEGKEWTDVQRALKKSHNWHEETY
ncbi:MAG: ferredoxin--NADP(+) reductase [Cyanobacteria bacterium J06642_12]